MKTLQLEIDVRILAHLKNELIAGHIVGAAPSASRALAQHICQACERNEESIRLFYSSDDPNHNPYH